MLGDKSLAHRAMLFSALAEGKSKISNFPDSGVTRSLKSCLERLGVKLSLENSVLEVEGNGFKRFIGEGVTLDCGNSATTMRLLLGALVGTGTPAKLVGSESLSKRPIRVDEHMPFLGFNNVQTSGGKLPAEISGCENQDTLPAFLNTKYPSAQVKSALILASLGRKSATTLIEDLHTRDHTENMLASMGAEIRFFDGDPKKILVSPLKNGLAPLNENLPGDISSAAFLLVAAALVPNSKVTIKNVLLNSSRIGYFKALEDAGCELSATVTKKVFGEKVGDVILKSPTVLRPIEISDTQQVGDMIDEFPAIAAMMAYTTGISVVKNAEELRYKESDRIHSIVEAFKDLGLNVHETQDGFSVLGSKILKTGCPIRTNNDHRIAMAFSLLSLVGDVEVDDSKIIEQSFPNFKETIEGMYS